MVRFVCAVIGAVVLSIASAAAQPYPSRPISLIVPYPAGGPLDQVARVMAEHMRGTLGQPFVIENVSGAGGSIGVGRVARATPNGYTIGIGDVGTQVLNGAVYPLTYDVMTDFEPVALLVASPLLVLSRSSLPAKTLTELVAWLKANQEKVSQGFIGSGTLSHLCGLYLQQTIEQQMDVRAVSRRGAGDPGSGRRAGRPHVPGAERQLAAIGAQRQGARLCHHVADAAAVGAGDPDRRRSGRAGLSPLVLAGVLGAEGHAEGHRRQAQRRRGRGAGG